MTLKNTIKTFVLFSLAAIFFCGFVNAQTDKNQKPQKPVAQPTPRLPIQLPPDFRRTPPIRKNQGTQGNPTQPLQRARYRVVLNGFSAHSQTWDHALQVDGKDDEVFIVSDTRMIDRSGRDIRTPSTNTSTVMGDTNSYTYRIQAGSASDRGGIKSGDNFPSNTPWRRPGNSVFHNRLPLMLWEGELIAGENAAVIIPTIWEWDGGEDMFNSWQQSVAQHAPAIAGAAVSFAFSSAAGAATATGLSAILPAASEFLRVNVGEARDRPIGTTKSGDGFAFNPQIMTLTYEVAENTIAVDSGRGRGIVSINYRDDPSLKGNYTLYIQVERLPEPIEQHPGE